MKLGGGAVSIDVIQALIGVVPLKSAEVRNTY